MLQGAPALCMQAVAQGKWLLIEDLNLAPPEVLAALVPLLGSSQLHLPQRAQVIKAAPGFQLLASITTAPGTAACMGHALSIVVFHQVQINITCAVVSTVTVATSENHVV